MSKSAESFEIEGRPTLKQLQTCQFYSIYVSVSDRQNRQRRLNLSAGD